MTQDQYGQMRGPGYAVRGDDVPDDENEEYDNGQTKPMTRFQKVASALRGGGPERDDEDPTATDQVAEADVAADQSARDQMGGVDQTARATDPEATPATQPDMFGTTTHAGNGAASTPQPQAGAATIADVPANGVAAGGTPASDVAASDVAASGVPADEATGTAGRHAAPGSGGTESRPGEAAAALGDFSDLTYGNLLPDATVYMEQWQQVQFKFVDDPHASVTEAADIVGQVTAKIEAAIQERQRAIQERQRAIQERQRSLRDRWGEGSDADTEALRATLRMYKTFLDQLIGSRAGVAS